MYRQTTMKTVSEAKIKAGSEGAYQSLQGCEKVEARRENERVLECRQKQIHNRQTVCSAAAFDGASACDCARLSVAGV